MTMIDTRGRETSDINTGVAVICQSKEEFRSFFWDKVNSDLHFCYTYRPDSAFPAAFMRAKKDKVTEIWNQIDLLKDHKYKDE